MMEEVAVANLVAPLSYGPHGNFYRHVLTTLSI